MIAPILSLIALLLAIFGLIRKDVVFVAVAVLLLAVANFTHPDAWPFRGVGAAINLNV